MSWSPIGRPVRVGLFEHSPDAYSCFRMLPQKPCPKPGSEVEIVQIVMNMLDWEWEVVDTNEAFVSCIYAASGTNAYPCRGLLMISEIRRRMGIIHAHANRYYNYFNPIFQVQFVYEKFAYLLAAQKTHLTYYYNMTLEGSSEKNVRRMNRILQYNPIIVHPKESDLMDEIKRGNVFYSTYDIEFLPYPGLTVIRDTTGIISYVAFGFSSNNKKLCHLFNEALLKILPGIPQITRAPGYAFVKAPEDTTIQVKKTRLSLNGHLEQLFYIYIIGVGICTVVFFTEIIVHRLVKLKNRQVFLYSLLT
ncbi:hypothetical protein WR25_17829 [Diploscapter pachys]|uniref:Uncharacterized protein n=1 Tax=Diploscapter pachys TaxID=2018661 RepID=A0A2A2KYM9_9BILA|nr:hypothetical protein WR25_17829 [Diploscapter pachys]